ncbi:uncharacterized protein LOC114275267 [Camellia sinensis]|uniref:uncharacterized protein LOC114275267 n=1 Tax=Camellia sinensis TaxID=4442 RepID=UPI0010357602|nr:uncharacterized protein LOC114275267 [Camellia sinensis]
MPGIDLEVTCHMLNVDRSVKPIIQRARRPMLMHVEAVEEEVEKLLEAKAIRELNYPTWLSNTVVVKKTNGKWRGDLTDRVARWAVVLGQYDLEFRPRKAIKGQVLADFVAEFTPGAVPCRAPVEKPKPCDIYLGNSFYLFVDGSSNRQRVGARVVLVSPDGRMLEKSIHLGFKASNNEAEYEALIAGLKLAVTMEADEVVVFFDSQLIVNQATGEYAARDERMIVYVKKVVRLLALFQDCRLQ